MDELELEFTLHPQLSNDCIELGDLPLCKVLLMNDKQFPWFILVPRRTDITEIYHLDLDEQQQLMKEVSHLAENFSDLFAAKKMNIASLGNIVPQLHMHIVVRKVTDPCWPNPVWGRLAAVPYTEKEIQGIRARVMPFLDI